MARSTSSANVVEVLELKGRVFHIVPTRPEDKDTSWTIRELVNGSLVEPADIVRYFGPKGFAMHHLRCSV
jgi:hypothetical protein